MAHVRSLSLQVHHYLDDWLLRNQQLDHLRTQTQGLLHLTTRLGWMPSLEKSELSPTQDFVFIGTHYRTDLGADVPSSSPVQRNSQSCSSDSPGKVCYGSGLSLTAGEVGIHVRSGALRPSQVLASSGIGILAHWCPSQGQLTDRIPLDHPFLDPFLKWWTKPTFVFQGRPIQSSPPKLAIYTDASTSSWGAHCGNQSAAGLWSATETTQHINELELLAIRKAVLHFLPLIRGKVVMIH